MVVPPALESRTLVVSMLAVDLDQLVEDTSCATKVLVAEVISEDEKDLMKCQAMSPDKGTWYTHELNAIAVLVVARDMGAVSDQDVATFCRASQQVAVQEHDTWHERTLLIETVNRSQVTRWPCS